MSRFLTPLLLGAALAPLAAVSPGAAQMVQPASNPDADALAAQMRMLAANPQDVAALVRAGELALRLDDASGAASLFARAERIDPHNARVKAGLGSLALGEERPGEALRRYAEAQAFGADPATFAADRGLAYDLIGQQERAQRDYRVALHDGANDETSRRYALSLGIAGKVREAEAVLDPLLRRGDRPAWRARAFILAMSGDRSAADKIATTMLPPGMAEGLAPFFARLPSLGATDRAFAVHFGELRAAPERLADARLTPPLPALGTDPYPPVFNLAAVTSRTETAAVKREDKRRRGKAPAIEVATAPVAMPLPAPPTYVASAAVEPVQIYAPPPVAQRTTRYAHTRGVPSPTQLANMASAAATTPRATPVTVASAQPHVTFTANRTIASAVHAPVRAMATPPPAAASTRSAAASPPIVVDVARATPSPDVTKVPAAPVAVAAVDARAPEASPRVANASPAIPRPAEIAATPPATALALIMSPPVETPPVPTAAVVASTPAPAPTVVRSEDAILASIIAGIDTSNGVTQPPPASAAVVETPPPAAPAPAPARAAETATVSQKATPKIALQDKVAKVVPTEKSTVLADHRAVDGEKIDATLPTEKSTVLADRRVKGGRKVSLAALAPRDMPPAVDDELQPVRGRKASVDNGDTARPTRRGAKPAAADQPDDAKPARKGRGRASADDAVDDAPPLSKAEARKVAAAKKLADARKSADAKEAAADKADRQAAKREPSRIWVQVAGGAHEGDLGKAWDGVRGKAPDAFKGRQAYATPLRATNRVLTGPFKTDAEARAYVNALAKKGIGAFTFTSEAGQKVAKLPTK